MEDVEWRAFFPLLQVGRYLDPFIDGDVLATALRFTDFPPGARTPDWLRSLVRGLPQPQLRAFLRWTTGKLFARSYAYHF